MSVANLGATIARIMATVAVSDRFSMGTHSVGVSRTKCKPAFNSFHERRSPRSVESGAGAAKRESTGSGGSRLSSQAATP